MLEEPKVSKPPPQGEASKVESQEEKQDEQPKILVAKERTKLWENVIHRQLQTNYAPDSDQLRPDVFPNISSVLDQVLYSFQVNKDTIDKELNYFIPADLVRTQFQFRHTPNNSRLKYCCCCSWLIYIVIAALLGIAVTLTYLNTSIQLILAIIQLTFSSLDNGSNQFANQIKGIAVAQSVYTGLIILVVPFVKQYGTKMSQPKISAELYTAFTLTASQERRVDLLVGVAGLNEFEREQYNSKTAIVKDILGDYLYIMVFIRLWMIKCDDNNKVAALHGRYELLAKWVDKILSSTARDLMSITLPKSMLATVVNLRKTTSETDVDEILAILMKSDLPLITVHQLPEQKESEKQKDGQNSSASAE